MIVACAGFLSLAGVEIAVEEPAARLAAARRRRDQALVPRRAGLSSLRFTGQGAASITRRSLIPRVFSGIGAQVAQLVEHMIENHGVGGSIPPLGTTSFGVVY
jgi:hypothetical protein